MQKCGTSFNFDRLKLDRNLVYSNESKKDSADNRLVNLYEGLARKTAFRDAGRNRSMHLHNTIFTAHESNRYLNRYHQQFSDVIDAERDNQVDFPF